MDFNRSGETDKIFEAFAKFQGEMPSVDLDATVKVKMREGGSYNFSYATFPNIVETAKPHLAKQGLGVTQLLSSDSLTTVLTHESGQFLATTVKMNNVPTKAQDYGSLTSYLKRYSYAAILGIVAEEDDDSNTASGNDFEKKENTKPATVSKVVGGGDTGEVEPKKAYPVSANQLNALKNLYGSFIDQASREKHGKETEKLTFNQASTLIADKVLQDKFRKLREEGM